MSIAQFFWFTVILGGVHALVIVACLYDRP